MVARPPTRCGSGEAGARAESLARVACLAHVMLSYSLRSLSLSGPCGACWERSSIVAGGWQICTAVSDDRRPIQAFVAPICCLLA